MKKYVVLILAVLPVAPVFSDNIADCEVFLRQPVMLDGEKTGAFIDTYVPATEFIDSVYDDKDGFETHIDGEPIKAVFCTRHSVIPSLRDFPILATGLPFVVSTDFDSSESSIVTIYYTNGQFNHVYNGPDLSEQDEARLVDAMEIFNLQPHKLGD